MIRNVVIDCADARRTAEFYRQLFGLAYRPGDGPPQTGEPDPRGADWLVLKGPGGVGLAFQQVADQPRSTWPQPGTAQMLHLDSSVPTAVELQIQRDRALALGATLLSDRFDDAEEPLYVFADPAGHPFCIFVAE